MSRFYFHVRGEDDRVLDPVGNEFESLDAARRDALEAAREIAAEAVKFGEPLNYREIEVADEKGAVVASVAISAVFNPL